MRVMQLEHPGTPLREVERPVPVPAAGQLLVRISACGVCRTDLHVVDGELPPAPLPIVPGHEIVGRVAALGDGATRFAIGDRVGIPWLGWSCGECRWCRAGRENLCDSARFTGYTLPGGYAEFVVADERFCLPLPATMDDVHVAPLLCAGLIGHRSLRATGDPASIAIYGFGAAAHVITQVAVSEGRRIHAVTRPGDTAAQSLARALGASWAGGTDEPLPERVDAAIIFAPAGELVPAALAATVTGGVVVCGGIHMSDIPSFPYALLWGERVLRSIANLTRRDGEEFLPLAAAIPVRTHVTTYPLARANDALDDLRAGRVTGAAVLTPSA